MSTFPMPETLLPETLLPETLSEGRMAEPCCPPAAAPRLTAAGASSLSERLKVLADPTRLRLLDLLAGTETPLCVCEITPLFEQNQPTISHHLKLLRAAGLVTTERRGIWAYYRATEAGQRSLAALTALP